MNSIEIVGKEAYLIRKKTELGSAFYEANRLFWIKCWISNKITDF